MKRIITILCAILSLSIIGRAQTTLSLEDCISLALEGNNELKLAASKEDAARYDKKIAAAYFYPKISAAATYQWTDHDIQLISDDQVSRLAGMGTAVQDEVAGKINGILSQQSESIQALADPAVQKLIADIGKSDLVSSLNSIGSEVGSALCPDFKDVLFVGVASLEQPVFAGGKIVSTHKMAKYAEQLSHEEYLGTVDNVKADITQAYWQIVAIASKKRLAENYSALLETMLKDTEALVQEGMATESDALGVKVKANEAKLTLTKATNGLALSKMLLCSKCGLALDSPIFLADEFSEQLPLPMERPQCSDEEILSSRSEIKKLDLARNIYEQKVKIARADMMPTIAISANYLFTNPNLNDGFQNKFGGMFAAGAAIKIPIFHGEEALFRTRKAKAEATYTQIRLDDARQKILLQVAQCRKQYQEAQEQYFLTTDVLKDAEENLRKAQVGYREGATASSTVLQAQTAWLSAHTGHIEAMTNLQISALNLQKAQGQL